MEISITNGYALWSKTYDYEKNPLIAVEEIYVEELLETLPNSYVLDAGAGTGRYALKLARRGGYVTAIDDCPEMLAVAEDVALKEDLNIDFHLASLENHLPFNTGTFDLVICALTLTHIPNMANVMQEFHRVLNREGYLLVTDFHPDSLAQGWRTEFSEGGITYQLPNMKYTRTDYLKAIKDSRFNLLKVIDVPIHDVPKGYLPEDVIHNYSNVNLCLIILSHKQ